MGFSDFSSYWSILDLVNASLPAWATSICLFFFASFLYQFPKSQAFLCVVGGSFAIWGLLLLF